MVRRPPLPSLRVTSPGCNPACVPRCMRSRAKAAGSRKRLKSSTDGDVAGVPREMSMQFLTKFWRAKLTVTLASVVSTFAVALAVTEAEKPASKPPAPVEQPDVGAAVRYLAAIATPTPPPPLQRVVVVQRVVPGRQIVVMPDAAAGAPPQAGDVALPADPPGAPAQPSSPPVLDIAPTPPPPAPPRQAPPPPPAPAPTTPPPPPAPTQAPPPAPAPTKSKGS